MKQIRKRHSADFKGKVALEALLQISTMSELTSKYGVHATQITRWKNHLKEYLPEIFRDNFKSDLKTKDELIERLYQQIGQQKVELDWIKKKVGDLSP